MEFAVMEVAEPFNIQLLVVVMMMGFYFAMAMFVVQRTDVWPDKFTSFNCVVDSRPCLAFLRMINIFMVISFTVLCTHAIGMTIYVPAHTFFGQFLGMLGAVVFFSGFFELVGLRILAVAGAILFPISGIILSTGFFADHILVNVVARPACMGSSKLTFQVGHKFTEDFYVVAFTASAFTLGCFQPVFFFGSVAAFLVFAFLYDSSSLLGRGVLSLLLGIAGFAQRFRAVEFGEWFDFSAHDASFTGDFPNHLDTPLEIGYAKACRLDYIKNVSVCKVFSVGMVPAINSVY